MRKIVRAALACGLALVCSAAALAAGGTAEDPLITLSKLRSSYLDTIQEAARQKAAALQSQAEQTMQEETERAKGALQAKAIGIDLDQVASQVRQQVGGTQMVTLEKGDQVTGPLGAGFVLREGSAKIVGTELINITAGRQCHCSKYLLPDPPAGWQRHRDHFGYGCRTAAGRSCLVGCRTGLPAPIPTVCRRTQGHGLVPGLRPGL